MAALKAARHNPETTEFHYYAGEQLPEAWGLWEQGHAAEDITEFHCYSLSVPQLTTALLRPRTWLLAEIDDLSQRLTRAGTTFETFVGIDWDLDSPALSSEPSPLRVRALSAVRQLMEILGLAESGVADLAGVSRNSIRNWRHGRDAYPATVTHLFHVASLISALDSSMGRERLVIWLNETADGERSRWDLLSDPDGPAAIAREASQILFSRPQSTLPSPELLELEPEAEYEDSVYSPEAFSSRPRRDRPNRSR